MQIAYLCGDNPINPIVTLILLALPVRQQGTHAKRQKLRILMAIKVNQIDCKLLDIGIKTTNGFLDPCFMQVL